MPPEVFQISSEVFWQSVTNFFRPTKLELQKTKNLRVLWKIFGCIKFHYIKKLWSKFFTAPSAPRELLIFYPNKIFGWLNKKFRVQYYQLTNNSKNKIKAPSALQIGFIYIFSSQRFVKIGCCARQIWKHGEARKHATRSFSCPAEVSDPKPASGLKTKFSYFGNSKAKLDLFKTTIWGPLLLLGFSHPKIAEFRVIIFIPNLTRPT